MKSDFINALKLTSTDLENVATKLNKLVSANKQLPALAYAGNSKGMEISFACRGCDGACKGSCSGGCTSW